MKPDGKPTHHVRRLGRWFEEGRAAVGVLPPDVALLARFLKACPTSL